MDMRTSASQFKAKLGRYMKAVRQGREVVITDRDEPVAKLVPYAAPVAPEATAVEQPRDPSAPPLGDVEVRPIRVPGVDMVSLLLEDRRRR
jgi:prevent-host-death family protein